MTLMLREPCLPITVSAVVLLALVACDPAAGGVSVGVGSAGASPEDLPPEPHDELIDDFEDGDLRFGLLDGEGHWVANDGENGDALVVEDGGANETARALLVTIREASASRTGFSAVLSPADAPELVAHDYSSCTGIELWAKSGSSGESDPGHLTVVVQSTSGSASAEVDLADDWQRFSLDWEDLVRGSGSGAGGAAGAAGADAAGAGGAGGDGTAGAGGAGGDGTAGAGGSAGSSAPSGGGAASAGDTPSSTDDRPLDPKQVQAIRVWRSSSMDIWIDEVKLRSCMLRTLSPPLPDPPELGSAGPEGSPVARYGQLQVVGSQLLDQSGAPVQLKGLSSMWLNWEDSGYAESKEALRWMRDNWNLSVIRAAMGVEEAGAYLSRPAVAKRQVETIVQNAIDLGVYVIVDWHSHEATSYRRRAREFFSEIAQKYGDAPNVIYETFNEPLRVSWSTELKPYHEVVVTSIREWDPDNLIILGTPQWSQLVDSAASDPVPAKNILYTLHFYACTHTAWLREKADSALAREVALFVTEWGATDADGGRDGAVCESEARIWLQWMADRGLSWTAWKLDDCVSDSTCILKPGAPLTGGWTEDLLAGHGPLVREWMLMQD
jgi:aryl-phospho-beta-D-glucosidase BglC (GH1 family)